LKNHPNEYSDEFDEHFKEWDGTTGYNLPHRNPWIYGKAEALLKYAI